MSIQNIPNIGASFTKDTKTPTNKASRPDISKIPRNEDRERLMNRINTLTPNSLSSAIGAKSVSGWGNWNNWENWKNWENWNNTETPYQSNSKPPQ